MNDWTVRWLSSRVPPLTGWLTGLHSKPCLPLWLQCEVFYVLSAPTICFYKAVPPLSPIHFPSSCLSFHPILSLAFCLFSSSFFTLSLYLSFMLSLFPSLSILYSPWSYLFVFWSAPSSFFCSFMQPTRPTSLSPSAFPPISLLCPPSFFLSTSWSLLLFPPFFNSLSLTVRVAWWHKHPAHTHKHTHAQRWQYYLHTKTKASGANW